MASRRYGGTHASLGTDPCRNYGDSWCILGSKKCSPIYEYSTQALNFVAVVGMITAIFAASIALVQNDIKKIIAYSTCSQLGYMFFAAGVGAYQVAMFHLFTHAFLKLYYF